MTFCIWLAYLVCVVVVGTKWSDKLLSWMLTSALVLAGVAVILLAFGLPMLHLLYALPVPLAIVMAGAFYLSMTQRAKGEGQ